MYLSDMMCRAAKTDAKPKKLNDGDGMYLLVKANGTKCWRMDYSYGGKRKTLSLGLYPEVSLLRAREKRLEARQQLIESIDPAQVKREKKLLLSVTSNDTFEVVAREWHQKRKFELSHRYSTQVLSILERDFIPDLGQIPVREITPLILLSTLRKGSVRQVSHI